MVPAIPVPAGRISLLQQLLLSARALASRTIEFQKKHDTFWKWAWKQITDTPPETNREHARHLASRQWLEDWMIGWIRWIAEKENIAFGIIISQPVTLALNNLTRIFQRQSRFWIAVLILITIGIISHATHR